MKKTARYLLILACAWLFCSRGLAQSPKAATPLEVRLQSPYVRFDFPAARSTLSSANAFASLEIPGSLLPHFTLRLWADFRLPHTRRSLLEIPGVLDLCLRQHEPRDRGAQNYPAYPMPDGSVPVLEATLLLQAHEPGKAEQPLVIGLPLALLPQAQGRHEIVLHFSGVRWSLYVDGRLYDNEFALGYPLAQRMRSWRIDPEWVSASDLYLEALQPVQLPAPTPPVDPNIQYWTPPFHNAWVGDVATLYHKGRYHVFYLFDRRGHGSKLGRGGHYFEHLSTADFRTWTEHEAATPLEHQWETFGTGTPFVWEDKLCLSYGLHTTRIYPRERTTLPMQWEYLEQQGKTLSIQYDTLQHLFPAGSTYAVSDDGVARFRKSHTLFHPCENPSIYVAPDGQLRMLANYGARGTWQSQAVDGGWTCVNLTFPLGGDCTFPFRWNGYDYIIGGFNRLWFKAESEEEYRDMVAEGCDFYNGLSVPAISPIPEGRYLMAGWLKTQHWGGPLVIHELIAHPDGRIGSKWMPEIVPATEAPVALVSKVRDSLTVAAAESSFLLTFQVYPRRAGKGRVAVDFLGADTTQAACQWQFSLDDARAQYATITSALGVPAQKTLREGGDVSSARDYAIEGGLNVDRPFTVRMWVHRSSKLTGPIIDTEIAGQRTMLTYRPGLSLSRVVFRAQDVLIRDVQLAPIAQIGEIRK